MFFFKLKKNYNILKLKIKFLFEYILENGGIRIENNSKKFTPNVIRILIQKSGYLFFLYSNTYSRVDYSNKFE